MIPKHGNKKFQCPHCNTVATQEWFTADNANNTALKIINHLYLNYRSDVADYHQDVIARFLKHIDNPVFTFEM